MYKVRFTQTPGGIIRLPSAFSHLHTGEAGLLVCKITPQTPFIGYTRDLEQTEKKRLHNVFERGDMYFNTGDLLVLDKNNFFYFQDRVGDTFR